MNYAEYTFDAGRMRSFMTAVYAWMACALVITAITAYYVAATPALFVTIMTNPWAMIGLVLFQIALVVALSLFLQRLNFFVALLMFLVYALSLGVVLSVIFYVYTTASIYQTFFASAAMFGGMALYGYFTKADLTTVGNISIMALLGLIVAMLVNLFIKSQPFDLLISAIGVVVFALLTAYDTQRIKRLAAQLFAERETEQKIALVSALALYLDFINIFLFMLRFMGQKRE